MNSLIEKEKKLNLALTKLKNLNLKNPAIKKDIENLNNQKNQLEIEKQELEEKYKSLADDYGNLSKKLNEFEKKNKLLSTNLNLDYVETLYREKLKFGKKEEIIIKLK